MYVRSEVPSNMSLKVSCIYLCEIACKKIVMLEYIAKVFKIGKIGLLDETLEILLPVLFPYMDYIFFLVLFYIVKVCVKFKRNENKIKRTDVHC